MREMRDKGEKELSRNPRRRLTAQQKASEQRRRRLAGTIKRAARLGIIALVALGGLGWLGYSIVTAKRLPPTSMADHTEEMPPGRILTTPMPLAIQKHMLEHADGKDRPGVIINYNCVQFRCAEGLIERLTEVARAYSFVYLAPYPEMDARIAVTRLGEILVLDDADQARIHEFIKRSEK